MRLRDIFDVRKEAPNFAQYFTAFTPPLDGAHLSLDRAVVGRDRISVPVDRGVVGVLQILYKNCAGGALGLREENDGDTWSIPQVQGARGKKAFRIASGLRWESLLAAEVKACAEMPDVRVRRITMPSLPEITNIDGAASQDIGGRYARVQTILGLKWSSADGVYVCDLK